MKAASRFTADRVSAKRSNIAAPSRQAHCRAAAGAYATNGFSFGGAGNPLACGPRAEHPQPEVHGAQIIHFLLQIRRGQRMRSEEHTSELQSQSNLVCRLLLEKKKKHTYTSSLPPARAYDISTIEGQTVHFQRHIFPLFLEGKLCTTGDAYALP